MSIALRLAVGAAPIRLTANDDTTPYPETKAATNLLVKNTGVGTIYLGGPNVTVNTGFELPVGNIVSLTVAPSEEVYAVGGVGGSVQCLWLGVKA